MRVRDLPERFLALCLLLIAVPVIVFCAFMIWCIDRQSPLYAAPRLKAINQPFKMWKLRTMRGIDDGRPTGHDKANQITTLGRCLRCLKIDELPQLWNVVRGDMTLVGPRPPTRWAVQAYPDLYASILETNPGMTGMATVTLGAEERLILGAADSPAEVCHAYLAKILPLKLQIEAFYIKRKCMALDLWILNATGLMILRTFASLIGRCFWKLGTIEARLQRKGWTVPDRTW